jgi:hypothetical protein
MIHTMSYMSRKLTALLLVSAVAFACGQTASIDDVSMSIGDYKATFSISFDEAIDLIVDFGDSGTQSVNEDRVFEVATERLANEAYDDLQIIIARFKGLRPPIELVGLHEIYLSGLEHYAIAIRSMGGSISRHRSGDKTGGDDLARLALSEFGLGKDDFLRASELFQETTDPDRSYEVVIFLNKIQPQVNDSSRANKEFADLVNSADQRIDDSGFLAELADLSDRYAVMRRQIAMISPPTGWEDIKVSLLAHADHQFTAVNSFISGVYSSIQGNDESAADYFELSSTGQKRAAAEFSRASSLIAAKDQ